MSSYFKVDMEKLKRRESERDYTTKKFHELLNPSKAKEREKKVEFFKEHEIMIYHGIQGNDMDYEFFVGCMEIYENTDVNYFYDFEYLRLKCQYETNEPSIRGYLQRLDYNCITITDEYLDKYRKDVEKTIQLMEFFNIGNLYGITIEKYKELYKNADVEWKILKQEISNNKKSSKEEHTDKLIESYFNFGEFNNKKFESIFNDCIKDIDMGKNTYTLNEIIDMNINLDKSKIFLVFLRKNNKVCYIGKTVNLISYIGNKNKEYNADSVAFYEIDSEYIDDIYVKSLIYFDMIAYNGVVKSSNRKYISLSMAKRVYKEMYRINLTHIKKIISKYDLERFIIGDTIVLDKIALNKATRDYLNLD